MDEYLRANMRFFVAGAIFLTTLGFVGGFLTGSSPTATQVLPASVAQAIGVDQQPQGVDFSSVWRAWTLLDERFVPASVATSTSSSTDPLVEGTPEQKRVWGMIQGLAESTGDPYTFFLPPVEQKQFEEDLSGEFSGVGMEIAVRDEILTVVSPLKGTPAERAGIKANDKVLEINGVSTKGIDITTAVNRIRGPKGTDVVLKMFREGWVEPRDITVTRDVINVPVLDTEHRADGIFVISLHNFTANSPGLFREALRTFIDSGSSRLILDLRGNPGGYLEASVEMASWFLPAGRVIVTEDYAGHEDNVAHRSRGYDVFNGNLRMVILVDKGSASASEILAGALRHYGKGQLVGESTFGKGSVQELVPLTSDTSLKITVARWLLPGGEQIPNSGIVPDVEVKISEEDAEAGRDPQLEKAVELLR